MSNFWAYKKNKYIISFFYVPGYVIPLGEEAQVDILLVDVNPHAEITEQVSPLLMAVILIIWAT